MKKTIAICVAVVAVFAAFQMGRSIAAGGLKSYEAVLNTGQQIPPTTADPVPTGAGLGVAHFSFNPGTRQICLNMTVTGWTGTISAAHIHPGRAGTNGGILITFTPETDGVWRNDCGDRVMTKSEVEQLNKGQMYINVHTQPTFGPGELRGQIFK